MLALLDGLLQWVLALAAMVVQAMPVSAVKALSVGMVRCRRSEEMRIPERGLVLAISLCHR